MKIVTANKNTKVVNFRWRIGFLMFLGIVINYMDRVNISHAILVISKEMSLSPFQQGIILSSFSWGYVLFMIFGGLLIDKFGSRTMNAISAFAWSIFTFAGTLVSGFFPFLATRFLLGAGEAPIFPGNARVVRAWFPLKERGKATSLFDVGSYVGSALVAPLVIWLILTVGWRFSFQLFSVIGIVWSIVWYLYYRDPEDHKFVSKAELNYINEGVINTQSDTKNISIWTLLKHRQIWGMSLGFFCYNYLKNFFLTWFPSYLVTERGFTLIKVGIVALIPPFCAIIGELIAGHLTDKMISNGVNLTLARKLPLCIGMLLSSVIIVAVFTTNPVVAVILLTISYTSIISASTGIWAIPGDIAQNKNQVGRIGAIQNTFSNIAGIVAPIITGYIFGITHSFVIPLIISGVLAIIGAMSYWFIVGELKPLPDLVILNKNRAIS